MTVDLAFQPKVMPLGPLPFPTVSWPNTGSVLAPPAWRPFDRWDMPKAARNAIVDVGGHVWRNELRGGDRSAASSACRNEAYFAKETIGQLHAGDRVALAFGIRLAEDFPTPDSFHVFAQIHAPDDYPEGYASPMLALEGGSGQFSVQNNAEGTIIGRFPFRRGEWQYLVIETLMERTPTPCRVWLGADGLIPDHTKPPTFERLNRMVPPTEAVKPSYPKFGQYRRITSSSATYVVEFDGPVVSTSANAAVTRLRGICRASALGAQPPTLPLRQVGESETRVQLAWDPYPNAIGYRFTRSELPAGKWGHTWNGGLDRAWFPKGNAWCSVQPLLGGPVWEWRP